jgi:hypothetical protein
MKIDLQTLTEKEKKDFKSLAKALGIYVEELLSLDFHNENIFDAGGEVKYIKYVFSKDNPSTVLCKIKGLNDENAAIVSVTELTYRS